MEVQQVLRQFVRALAHAAAISDWKH